MARYNGSYSSDDLMQRKFKEKLSTPERAEINYRVSGFTPDDDELRDIVNGHIAQEISAHVAKCVNVQVTRDDLNLATIIRGTVNFYSPEITDIIFLDDVFTINGEEFSNDEMVQSIKNTYPERFL